MARNRGRRAGEDHAALAAAIFANLTVRQRLISVWMTAGFSREEVAQHLDISQQELSMDLAETALIARRIRS